MTIEVEGVKLYLQFKILVQEKEVKYECTISKCSRDRKKHKRLREEKGITVKELQKIFGFDTPQAIYRWQRGEILPCLDNLLVLAKILDVQVEDLIIQNQIK